MMRAACYYLSLTAIVHTCGALTDRSLRHFAGKDQEELPRFHTFPHKIAAESDQFGHSAARTGNFSFRVPQSAFPAGSTQQERLRRLLEMIDSSKSKKKAKKAAAAKKKAATVAKKAKTSSAPAPTAKKHAKPTRAPTEAPAVPTFPPTQKPKLHCSGIVKVYMNGGPFHGPSAVDWDSKGNMWVANDISNSILKIERTGGAVVFGLAGESSHSFRRPLGLAINSRDVVYVTNILANSIVRIYPNGQVEQVVKGKPIVGPLGITIDSKDNIFVANAENNQILKIKYPRGPITLYASSRDKPQVAGPQGLTTDSKDNLFIANGLNNVLVINSKGTMREYAKGGLIRSPRALAVDSKDNVFISNTVGNEIMKIAPVGDSKEGNVTIFARTPSNLKARNLWGMQVNIEDDLFVADWSNNDLLSIAPPGPPSIPTIGTAKLVYDGNGKTAHAVVSFTPPVHNGGCKILDYTVSSYPDDKKGVCEFSPCTVKGLKEGTTYYFYVRARNFDGKGASSSLSNTLHVTGPPTPAPTAIATVAPTAKMTSSPQQLAQQEEQAAAAAEAAAQAAAATASATPAPAASSADGGMSTTMMLILVIVVAAPLVLVPVFNQVKAASGPGAAVEGHSAAEESTLLRKPRAATNQDTEI